jgi:hypothetical protein
MPGACTRLPVDRSRGVICDQRIMLNSPRSANRYPEHLRRIRFKDPETGKTLVFLTNNTTLPALTVCALYKNRWTVELFFKWIKRHLRVKKFLGTSENAVKTQVWCAIATYVLIAILKKELHLDASLCSCRATSAPTRPLERRPAAALPPLEVHHPVTGTGRLQRPCRRRAHAPLARPSGQPVARPRARWRSAGGASRACPPCGPSRAPGPPTRASAQAPRQS